MKVSIATITYNSAKTLEDTIKSIQSQDYDDLEYVIWDGGSNDETYDIINSYSSTISTFKSGDDLGIYDAINKGIDLCSGSVIGLLHSDDVFASPDVVSTIARVFKTDPQIMAVYGNITFFEGSNKGVTKRKWKSKPYYKKFFEDGEIPPHPSLFVRTSAYQKYGNYFPHFKISSDYELMLRFFKLHKLKVSYIDKTIVNMRLGGESTKNWKNIFIGNKEVLKAWKMNNLRPPVRFYFLRPLKKIKQLIFKN